LPTDFVLSVYADRALLIVTQLGGLGTILSCSSDQALPGAGDNDGDWRGDGRTYSVAVVMGKRDEPLLPLCGRQVAAAAAAAGCTLPLVLSLGLKTHSLQAVREVVGVLTSGDVAWTRAG
jgi:hypothetical protein